MNNKLNLIEEELLKMYNLSNEEITYSDIQGIAIVKAKEILNLIRGKK